MNDRVMWFGRHEGWLRWLAHGVKDGDEECVRKAAGLFDLMLPDECVVVPMPSHEGRSSVMWDVAEAMRQRAETRKGRWFEDCLRCFAHPSCYEQKKLGLVPAPFSMWLEHEIATTMPVFVIDNVVASGVTAQCALAAFDQKYDVNVCALTSGVGR